MKLYRTLEEIPRFERAVMTIGTFDGVHLGHKQILTQLKQESEACAGTSVVLTFFPHPKQVVSAGPIQLLNSPEEKYQLLENAGIEHIVEIPFNSSFSEQPAISYIRDFLVKVFQPHMIIIGYDHRFGKNREGSYQLLEDEASRGGFVVKEIPEHVLANVTISSTKIRRALLACEIETANELLGYEYFFTGRVVEGNKLGRTIGYPTANIEVELPEKLVPGNAVYAVDLNVNGKRHKGMLNIGTRPTVEGHERTIEAHIFNFDENIYGTNVTVYMKRKLRDEVKFSGLEALKEQLAIDAQQAQQS